MIEALKSLSEIGWLTVAIVIILVITFIPQFIDSWNRFLNVLGYPTKKSIKDKEKEEEIKRVLDEYQRNVYDKQEIYHQQSIAIRDGLIENQKKLEESQQEIKDSLNELKKIFINKEIDDMRWELLNFANSVMSNDDYNKEQYDHVLDVYKNYEDILEENGMENGRVDMSMDFVKKKYAELMERGFNR